jgi:hypothetical protein
MVKIGSGIIYIDIGRSYQYLLCDTSFIIQTAIILT